MSRHAPTTRPNAARPVSRPALRRPSTHFAPVAGGRPLDAATRGDMESRLGFDFSRVRVHTGEAAAASAAALGARAFTTGSDIAFGAGAYRPDVAPGRRTLAHELVHVMQQTERVQRLEIQDCSDAHRREVGDAVTLAGTKIRATIDAITASPTPIEFPILFDTEDRLAVARVGLNLSRIASRLPHEQIACTTGDDCEGPIAAKAISSLNPFAQGIFDNEWIQVCQPAFHNFDADERAEVLVHEGAHLYLDAEDHDTYFDDCEYFPYNAISWDLETRMSHADTYRCLVKRLRHRRPREADPGAREFLRRIAPPPSPRASAPAQGGGG